MESLKKLWRSCRQKTPTIEEQDEPEIVEDDGLETPEEKIIRWRSIRVLYFDMFLMSLGFSIVLTGVWPYLDKLDPYAGKEFMGFVVAANPVGQMLFSPLIGWWANKSGSIRAPMLTTVALFVISSAIYSSLHLFTTYTKYWMVWTRFLIGVSGANTAATRSYLSAATRLSERTGAVSMLSLAQVMGFVIGPPLQAAVTPLGKSGLMLGPIHLDMFTAAGWINVLLGIANFVCFLPFVFTERKIAAKEAMITQGMKTEKEAWKAIKPDYICCWTMIVSFFVLVFNFVLLETLATSLTMDQFAWSKAESLKYMGIIMSVGAVVACSVFALIGPLTKIVQEKTLMLWGGFLMTMLGSIFCLPWGPEPPKLAIVSNITNIELLGDVEILGCPDTQAWCKDTPRLQLTQFLIAYVCVCIGYPLGATLIQTIFSKLLGPRPQGVWMGLMTGAGCFSRVVGPIYVAYIYSRKGPMWTFSSTTSVMIIWMLWIQLVSGRLKPPAAVVPEDKEMQPLGRENKC